MKTVVLLDGREVSSYSDEWRIETRDRELEAREILKLPTRDGRKHAVERYGSRRGDEARRRLEDVIRRLWELGVRG